MSPEFRNFKEGLYRLVLVEKLIAHFRFAPGSGATATNSTHTHEMGVRELTGVLDEFNMPVHVENISAAGDVVEGCGFENGITGFTQVPADGVGVDRDAALGLRGTGRIVDVGDEEALDAVPEAVKDLATARTAPEHRRLIRVVRVIIFGRVVDAERAQIEVDPEVAESASPHVANLAAVGAPAPEYAREAMVVGDCPCEVGIGIASVKRTLHGPSLDGRVRGERRRRELVELAVGISGSDDVDEFFDFLGRRLGVGGADQNLNIGQILGVHRADVQVVLAF